MKKALLALIAAGVLMSSFAAQAFIFGGCCNNGRTTTCRGCRYVDTGDKWKLEQ